MKQLREEAAQRQAEKEALTAREQQLLAEIAKLNKEMEALATDCLSREKALADAEGRIDVIGSQAQVRKPPRISSRQQGCSLGAQGSRMQCLRYQISRIRSCLTAYASAAPAGLVGGEGQAG